MYSLLASLLFRKQTFPNRYLPIHITSRQISSKSSFLKYWQKVFVFEIKVNYENSIVLLKFVPQYILIYRILFFLIGWTWKLSIHYYFDREFIYLTEDPHYYSTSIKVTRIGKERVVHETHFTIQKVNFDYS